LGYDARFIGQVNSIGLLTFACVSFPAGILGTRWTSSQMLRAGLGSVLLGTVLLPLAEFSPPGWQESWLVLTYALTLAGFSLYIVNAAPFLMTSVGGDKQSNAFAIQTALLALAAFAGSLFGGMLPSLIVNLYGFTLDDPQPYRYTLLLVPLVVLVAFFITLRMVEQPEENSDASSMQDERAVPKGPLSGFTTTVIVLIGVMTVVRFFQVTAQATTAVFFNVYLDTQFAVSPAVIGTIASIGRLITVPAVLLAPRLIRRTSTGTTALWASLVTALCLLPLAFVPSWGVAAIGYIGVQAATNLRFTAFLVYIMVLVPRRQQAVMAGAGEMAAGLSFAVMAWGGGIIVESASFSHLFLLGSVLSGLGTWVFWLHLRSVGARKAAQIGTTPS
jgi:predicted MFS family arabinose efflux permease